MRTWTLRFRATDTEIFEQIRSGLKTVETRAATVRHRPIQVGDGLKFVCGKESFVKTIAKIEHFASVDAMTKKIDYKKIMPSADSVAEMKKVYSSFSAYEQKIREFGILAFHLK